MRAEEAKFYNHFFDGNRRKYVIPVYQRNYDWSLEQCEVLFNDLVNLEKEGKEHFIGTVIQVQQDEYRGVKNFIVIDGQQRLITIYLLIKALLNFEDNIDRKEVLHDLLHNNFKGEDNYQYFEENKLKLKANPNDNKVLRSIMEGDFEDIDTSSNVYKNYEFFKMLINDKIKNGYTTLELRKSIEKLVVVVVSLDKRDDPQVVFERINSTGIPLELDDLVRNYVLMTDKNQEELFNKYWVEIERLVEKQDRSDFIIDFLNSMLSSQVSSKNSYEMFKKWAETDNKTNEEILIILKRFARYYRVFTKYDNNYSEKTNELLKDLRTLDQSTPYTFLFHIFELHYNKIIDDIILEKFIMFILNYSIRRLICEVPSGTQRGLYKRLFRRLFNNLEEPIDYYDVFVSFMINNLEGTYDEFPSDYKFKQFLTTTRLYRNRKLTKYLLAYLENNNNKEIIDLESKNITIEHIMPQNSENKSWQKELGENYIYIYSTYLDTLGNITLTGYNSELSDNNFKTKQSILKKQNIKITHINKEFIESDKWTEEEILKRAERLSDELIEAFKTPEYSNKIYHKQDYSDLVTLTLEEPDKARGFKPISFTFDETKVYEKTYKEITIKTLEMLYNYDDKILKELALEKYRPYGKNTRIFISFDPTDMKYSEKINNSDIFIRVGLSSSELLFLLKQVFKKYELPLDIFNIEARKK